MAADEQVMKESNPAGVALQVTSPARLGTGGLLLLLHSVAIHRGVFYKLGA